MYSFSTFKVKASKGFKRQGNTGYIMCFCTHGSWNILSHSNLTLVICFKFKKNFQVSWEYSSFIFTVGNLISSSSSNDRTALPSTVQAFFLQRNFMVSPDVISFPVITSFIYTVNDHLQVWRWRCYLPLGVAVCVPSGWKTGFSRGHPEYLASAGESGLPAHVVQQSVLDWKEYKFMC